VIALKAPKKLPRVLTPDEVQASRITATGFGTGCCLPCSMPPACALVRHSGRGTTISPPPSVRRQDNANGARTKSPTTRTVPVSAELIRLFADSLHTEYGDLDSDYGFVNLWAVRMGIH
jgi:integrase/recombinase XerD